jgi:hypothetical protein
MHLQDRLHLQANCRAIVLQLKPVQDTDLSLFAGISRRPPLDLQIGLLSCQLTFTGQNPAEYQQR